MADIHITAVIAQGAQIADDVSIGPYCCVGGNVTLGAGVVLHSHVVIDGDTEVGAGGQIYPFASVGLPPQDTKFGGELSKLVIGENTTIREHCTLNPGTQGGGMITRVAKDCLLMVGVHVAHDCMIEEGAIIVNNVILGGHVTIGEHAIVGGHSAVHQFVRIGAYAMIGGASALDGDVIPYGLVLGNRAVLTGLNLVGLKRRGISREIIRQLREAYREIFFGDGIMKDRLPEVGSRFPDNAFVQDVVGFLSGDGSRPLCKPQPDQPKSNDAS